jgi:hypothetical protein
MSTQSLCRTDSVADIKTAVPITLKNIEYVGHRLLQKGPAQWTGPSFLAGAIP